jgi:hypothetical protein
VGFAYLVRKCPVALNQVAVIRINDGHVPAQRISGFRRKLAGDLGCLSI